MIFFLSYPVVGRLQPVVALEKAISNLGKIDSDNYVNFRYLQLELIVKQCELLSDIAGYINSIEKFTYKESIAEYHTVFMEVYKSLVMSHGNDVHRFFESVGGKDDQFFYEIMGYDIIDQIQATVEPLVTKDELNNSVNIIKSIFKDMARFQSTFWGVYNAYKHGYRLFVDKAKCGVVECSGVSGDLDLLVTDSIIFVGTEGKRIPVISFSRDLAAYRYSFFYLFQGIINAFNAKLMVAFGGFLGYDLSAVKRPSFRVFRRIGECFDISF